MADVIDITENGVSSLFKGSTVLITGVTGFIGKVLLEKILRTCDVGKVYVIMRNKRGVLPDERLKKVISAPVFERVKSEKPEVFDNVVVIPGDVSEPNAGMSSEDIENISKHVNIVLHVASTVKFNEELDAAVKLNARGTYELLNIATKMEQLKSFVYVSTAYSSIDKDVIEEKVYGCDSWKQIIKISETMEPFQLGALTPKVIGKFPNTYCYTKRLAENIVHDFRDKIPVVIYRPSIVCYSKEEPFPGWIDTMNGQSGLALGMSSGIQHVLYADANVKANLIPVDYCVNGCIAAAWYRYTLLGNSCPVFNAVMPKEQCMRIVDTRALLWKAIWEAPIEKSLVYPRWIYTQCTFLYYLMIAFTHIIPGLLFDLMFKMQGVKFSLMDVYRKMYNTNDLTRFFLCNEFTWKTAKYEQLHEQLSDKDKVKFGCSYLTFDVEDPQLTIDGILGIKKFILKEKVDEPSLDKARHRLKKLFWFDKVMFLCFFYIIYSFVFKF